MKLRSSNSNDSSSIESLYASVFTTSEGEAEGQLIGRLARGLMAETDGGDVYGFVAHEDEQIIGAIFFSRVTFAAEGEVFILGPVAVDTAHQRCGIGRGPGQSHLIDRVKRGAPVRRMFGIAPPVLRL